MPLSDLTGRRERTASGVEVSAPTVRSFYRALEVFGAEIALVRQAARSIEGPISADVAIAPFLITPDDGRLAYVLEGLAQPFVSGGVEQIARCAASFLVPIAAQIDALLGDPEATGDDSDEDVSPGVLLVFGVAERWRCTPMEVMDAPLGVFLDAVAAYSRPPRDHADEGSLKGGMAPDIPGFPSLDSKGELI